MMYTYTVKPGRMFGEPAFLINKTCDKGIETTWGYRRTEAEAQEVANRLNS